MVFIYLNVLYVFFSMASSQQPFRPYSIIYYVDKGGLLTVPERLLIFKVMNNLHKCC